MPCDAGTYLEDNGTAATYHNSKGNCIGCQAGMYSESSAGKCNICSSGTWSNKLAPKCKKCVAGKYLEDESTNAELHDDITDCLTCLPGTYSILGSKLCNICKSGRYSLGSAASCNNCTAGTFLFDNSLTREAHDSIDKCNVCRGGKYSGVAYASKYLLTCIKYNISHQ
jgi:hypothetical protein